MKHSQPETLYTYKIYLDGYLQDNSMKLISNREVILNQRVSKTCYSSMSGGSTHKERIRRQDIKADKTRSSEVMEDKSCKESTNEDRSRFANT